MQRVPDDRHDVSMTPDLTAALDQLCSHFDAELVRQRAVLDACRVQGEAMRAHDMEALDAASKGLMALMEDALAAEKDRLRLLREVVEPFRLEVERQTLTALIEAVPEPWSSRMQAFQTEIREVLAATRSEVRRHAGFLGRAGRIIERSVSAIIGCAPLEGDAYDREGKEPARGHRSPALVNTLG
ncbi:MAG: hypothetical protein IID09_00865 [Candidatus Hydrogenedentes bacterium]|nr:hypothetical protein [Candidatus Hydrogenedentota bacterium]